MWQGFNQLANAVKEQAEAATRDLGLDSQLENARNLASGLLLDASPSKSESHEAEEQGVHWDPTANGRSMDVSRTGKHHACLEGPASHYPQQPLRSEQADARWQGLDNGGFDEVPLGSPPLRAPQADSSGGPLQLEKVAHSLRAFSKGNGEAAQDAAAKEASQLRTENATLKQRLAAVESEAVEAFGELEDLKDKLQAAERARTAAQLHRMPPQREDSGDLAATVQALCTDLKAQREAAENARRQAEEERCATSSARQRAAQLEEEMSQKLQEAGRERETLLQQLQALQQSAHPPVGSQVLTQVGPVEEGAPEERGPATDEVADLKAKITKLKRQALNFKNKLGEAVATRDVALAELQALKEGKGGAAAVPTGEQQSAAADESTALRKQLQSLQEEHANTAAREQSTAEALQKAQLDCECLSEQLRSATDQLQEHQQGREALLAEQQSLRTQLQKAQNLVEFESAAKLELQRAGQGQADLVAQLQAELTAAGQARDSLQTQLDVFKAKHDAALSEAAAARRELQERQKEAAEQLKQLQAQPTGQQQLHAQQLVESQEACQNLEEGAKVAMQAAMQDAERDRNLAVSLAEERLRELQALRAELQGAAQGPAQLPGPPAQPGQPTPSQAAAVEISGQAAEQHLGQAAESSNATSPTESMQSNPLFSPAHRAPVEGTPLREAPAAAAHTRKPGGAMRKIKELQAALNRKDIELVALQAQLQAALQSAQSKAASEGEKPEAPSSPAQPAAVTAELQEQKQAAEAECSKLEKDISELRASLDTEAAQRMSAEEELLSLRECLSGWTAKTQEAQQRVVELTAEVDSASEQALKLRDALAAAQAEAGSARIELTTAQSHKEEAAARLEASDAAVKGLKERQADLEQQLACLQDNLAWKAQELSALRDGSAVESSLASTSMQQAEARAAAAEEDAAAACWTAEAAQAALEEAQQQASASAQAADKRAEHAQKACAQREAELVEARAEARALRDALDAERAASAAAAAALESDLQQRHATERDSALGDANAGFARCLQEQKQHFEGQLGGQAAKFQEAEDRVQQLTSELEAARAAAEGYAEEGARMQELLRESETLRQQLVQATAELQTVQHEAQEAQAAAKERQKRFTMLNATFRKKEEALIVRAEEAERALSQARIEAAGALQQTAQAGQGADRLRAQIERLQSEVHTAVGRCAAAEKARDSAEKAAADASAELVALRLEIQSLQAAQSKALAEAEDFDQQVAAAVAVREEELAEQSKAAEEAVAHAREEMARAEARSAAAEAAKIELSLRLAAALSEQEAAEDVSGVPTARSSTQTLEEAMQRMEELELAASMASRRAAAAEAELHRMKQLLDLTDKRAKELAWQIKMISDPKQIGGQQSRPEVPSGMAGSVLDLFGCGANFRR